MSFPQVSWEDWLEDVAQRQEVVRSLAEKNGAIHLPLGKVLETALKEAPPEYWLVDGVHPRPPFPQRIADAYPNTIPGKTIRRLLDHNDAIPRILDADATRATLQNWLASL